MEVYSILLRISKIDAKPTGYADLITLSRLMDLLPGLKTGSLIIYIPFTDVYSNSKHLIIRSPTKLLCRVLLPSLIQIDIIVSSADCQNIKLGQKGTIQNREYPA